MGRMRWKIAPLIVLALLLTALFAGGGAADARASTEGPPLGAADVLEAPAETTLGELRAEPSTWLGRRVRFVVQLRGPVADWNPFLTRFGSEDWAAFGGWCDRRFTWEKSVFEDPTPRLFVRRGNDLVGLLEGLRPYRRVRVVGVVREVFLGEPWIEIEQAELLDTYVTQGSLLHVCRALELVEESHFPLALEQLQRARSAPLPEHALAELDRLEEEAREAQRLDDELRRQVR